MDISKWGSLALCIFKKMTIKDIMMTCQVTDILTYGMKKTRLKTLQMSPTPGTEELVKKASDVIPILEIWN